LLFTQQIVPENTDSGDNDFRHVRTDQGSSMAENPQRPDAAPEREPQPEFSACEAPDAAESWPDDWRETTLLRLEAWVEERERLIDELERRIDAGLANVVLHPSALSSEDFEIRAGQHEATGNGAATR
jgi:hypothetical protein